MGFKSDREFLRNITVGAVGNRQIVRHLNAAGLRIIELERGSLGNKIWATKIKRLRVPDLLCLRSGTRIESRAKGTLKIIVSHSQNNPDRAWDKGLRDADLVACIHCRLTDDVSWQASKHIAFFRVGDLRATRQLATVSRMKSAAEGSEVFLTWAATVPNQPGRVVEVSQDTIRVRLLSGRSQAYELVRRSGTQRIRLHPHVSVGDEFGAGDRIIASALPESVQPRCENSAQYDFIADLGHAEPAVV